LKERICLANRGGRVDWRPERGGVAAETRRMGVRRRERVKKRVRVGRERMQARCVSVCHVGSWAGTGRWQREGTCCLESKEVLCKQCVRGWGRAVGVNGGSSSDDESETERMQT
jgi:hypothetical protein